MLEWLQVVMDGEDCHDGPYAQLMREELKPLYEDLLEYLVERKERKLGDGMPSGQPPDAMIAVG